MPKNKQTNKKEQQPEGEDKNRKQFENMDDFENPAFYVTLKVNLNDGIRYENAHGVRIRDHGLSLCSLKYLYI